jgi:hypothetical protein
MNKTVFTAYAAAAEGNPSGSDHVAVSTEDGADWGCFGRTVAEMRPAENFHQVAQGTGYRRWAELIVGSDNAGLHLHDDSKCHNLANRILAVAHTDVRKAGADVVVMCLYGKYGFNIPGYIERIRKAGAQVNTEAPGTLSEADIEAAVALVNRAKQDELEIIVEYFREALPPNSVSLSDQEKAQVVQIYSEFSDKRASLQGHSQGYVAYLASVKILLLDALRQFENLLGKDRFIAVFKAAPECLRQNM